jgi:hypothetical protein
LPVQEMAWALGAAQRLDLEPVQAMERERQGQHEAAPSAQE